MSLSPERRDREASSVAVPSQVVVDPLNEHVATTLADLADGIAVRERDHLSLRGAGVDVLAPVADRSDISAGFVDETPSQ